MTSPINSPNPPEPPENLRDARLVQALQHMPDAHMQPSAQTRQAVLQEALRAAAPSPTAVSRWWHAWVGQPGQRVPLSAAIASLAIASFVTVLWYGQEVPDAAPERSPVVQREEASKKAIKETEKGASGDTSQDKAEMASGPSARKAADTPVAHAKAPPATAAAPSAASPEREMAHKAASALAPVAVPAAPAAADALAAPAAAEVPASVAVNSASNSVSSATESRADSARAAPPPSPAAAPAPVAAGGLAKSQAYASAPQRSFSNAPALADAQSGASASTSAESKASPALTISVDGVKRSVRLEQAQNLLDLLRGLSYGLASVVPQQAEPDADLVVEIAGEERWAITPDHVLHQMSTMRAQSDITPAQYATLRRLAMERKAQP